MAEINESMQKVVTRISNQHSLMLAAVYTIGHIVIAMACNYFITGTSLNMAAMDAIIEPLINGFWFYMLHKAYQIKTTQQIEQPREKNMDSSKMTINIGIADADREAISQALSKLLADSYTLYLKTHNFHWNVTGPMFNTLHNMFMDQYTELWNALDVIAERIRALGHFAPGSYKEFAELSSLDDAPSNPPSAEEMVAILVKGHEAVARTARDAFAAVEKANDQPSADILTQRLDVHEKTAWMLRSLLAS